jgi:hypothetical protein
VRLLPGSCPAFTERVGGPGSLFCLAPHGVCRAPALALRAVGSYPAFSPLPSACAWGGLFSVTLSVAPGFRPTPPRLLRGMLPGGVRTFLYRLAPAAIICPTSASIIRESPHGKGKIKRGRRPERKYVRRGTFRFPLSGLRSPSESFRMPDDAVVRWPIFLRPLGPFAAVARPARVESQSSNDEEDVAVAGINADPIPFPGISVATQRARSRGLVEPPSSTENIGSRAGTIVSGIDRGSVARAIKVRQTGNPVARGDCRLHFRGSVWRRDSIAVAQIGRLSRHILINIGGLGAPAEKQSEQWEEERTTAEHHPFFTRNGQSSSRTRC